MQFINIDNKRRKKEFLDFPTKIYKGDPNWVRPWDHDIESVFDPSKNKRFENGECERWILKNDAGEIVGRVAAFFYKEEAYAFEQPTGGMGFFECIDDQKVAFMLFAKCKAWLEERGMEAMDGPINFGEKNMWWGLHVDGTSAPPYGFNYHPRYYRKFFEAYGFQTFYEQYTYAKKFTEANSAHGVNERNDKLAQRVLQNKNYSFPIYSKKQKEFFLNALIEIYNKAWVSHESFKPMTYKVAKSIFKQLDPIIQPELAIFCFYNENPIGFFINIPDINMIIKHLNGKFSWYHKLKFMYLLKTGKCKKLFGMLYGITPRFQGRGITPAMTMIANSRNVDLNPKGVLGKYAEYEMGWLGDFNPVMLKIAEAADCYKEKTLITYRKLFDESKPFVRRPIINQ